MGLRRLLTTLVVVLLLGGGAAGLYFTQTTWQAWLQRPAAPTATAEEADHDHDHDDRIKVSPEARANLKLVVRPLERRTWWRTLQVPGVIVDRPGQSDQGITAPVMSVVTQAHVLPGDVVRAGDPLFTLRLVSERLQNSQAEFFKTTQELKLNQEQIDRLKSAANVGSVPMARLIELENQQRRLLTQEKATRQELVTHGLSAEQIEAISQGRFVKEITVTTPAPAAEQPRLVTATSESATIGNLAFEVKEVKVHLGSYVQAGELLGLLANHQLLYIEGRAFKQEVPLLERAAQEGWPIEAEFTEEESKAWPPLEQPLRIRHLANTVDPVSRTSGFYVPLVNQSRSYEKDGRTFLIWRYRPGQRVRLRVPVEEFRNVLVLPAAAVVREGPEAWVFRQNGDYFERRSVRVLFEDYREIVISPEGGVAPGQYVALNGAAALQRVLKAQQAGGEGGHDHDHDHHH